MRPNLIKARVNLWPLVALLLGLALAIALVACGGGDDEKAPTATIGAVTGTTGQGAAVEISGLKGDINVDGSSTVFPITEAMAEEFGYATDGNVRITVGVSGTGGGFKKFCAGEIHISDASRPIKQSEVDLCAEGGVDYVEIPCRH